MVRGPLLCVWEVGVVRCPAPAVLERGYLMGPPWPRPPRHGDAPRMIGVGGSGGGTGGALAELGAPAP